MTAFKEFFSSYLSNYPVWCFTEHSPLLKINVWFYEKVKQGRLTYSSDWIWPPYVCSENTAVRSKQNWMALHPTSFNLPVSMFQSASSCLAFFLCSLKTNFGISFLATLLSLSWAYFNLWLQLLHFPSPPFTQVGAARFPSGSLCQRGQMKLVLISSCETHPDKGPRKLILVQSYPSLIFSPKRPWGGKLRSTIIQVTD